MLQGLYWIVSAAAMDYAATPLLRERGFSSISIGIISGAKFISLMFFQYFLGRFADAHKDRISLKKIVSALSFIAIAAALALLYFPGSFALTLIIFIIFGGTINCILPLIESLSIDYMSGGMQMNYTLSRATGSFTYCVSAYLLGVWTGRMGMDFSLVFLAVTMAAFEAVNLMMPQPQATHRTEIREQTHSTMWLLTNCDKYRWFLIECFFIFLGYDMNISFLYDRVKDIGGTNAGYGLVFSVISMFEIPVALAFDRILRIRGLTIERLMAGFGVFCTARAFFTTVAPDMTMMILSQVFELFGTGVYYAGSVYFVMKTVPAEDSTKGMSLVNLFAVGASEAIAFFVSGVIRSALGVMPLMYISCLVSAAGIICGIRVASPSYH